ncbi:MAG: hypothetical protein NTU69_11075 [Proteobacteria bacterium]|nr:hypothetical protein [Pseudomonadota bacterium]
MNNSMTYSDQRNTEVGYGYFAGYSYPELLDKFRNLRDQGIKPETIFAFNDERERSFALFKYPRVINSLRNAPSVIYSRKATK